MKNFNLFMNEKKEKLKIAGSIVGGITIIALSSCNISDIKNDDSSIETSTLSISTTTTPNEESSVSITSSKTESTKKETTTQTTTTTSTTTKAPETMTTTTNEIITPAPVATNIPTTEKPEPVSTTVKTTKVTQTTTKKQTTTIKEEEPIEYETRTDEIIGYYNSVELNNTTKLTKQNVNNYEDFLSVANNTTNTCFYQVYYNLDTNKREKVMTGGYLENILFLTLLNEQYMNDSTIAKILKPYSHEELSYMTNNTIIIFNRDLYEHTYYDFSSITIDKKICSLLTNIQNAYKKDDYKTVEKLCNENYKKYNDFVDLLLLMYEYNMPEISEYITDENSFDLSLQIIDKTGIYERAHQKTLVLQ